MKDQIEDIARISCNICKSDISQEHCTSELCESVMKDAEAIYNAGYRKQIDGEWVFNRGRCYGEPAYYCSNCSEGASEYGMDNFCPNCGARMKGADT